MKKILLVVLTFFLCVSMFGCAQTQDPQQDQVPAPEMKTEILGNWICVGDNTTAAFQADGAGVLSGKIVTWKYDPDSNSYMITDEDTYTALFDIQEGIEHLSVDGTDYYRPHDQQKAVELTVVKRREDIAKRVSGMRKIQLDTTYVLTDNMTIKFSDITRQDEDILMASYSVTNYRPETMLEPICSELSGKCYIAGQAKAMDIYGMLEFAYPIESGETVEGIVMLCELIDVVQPTVQQYGELTGVIHFGLYGTHYYLDLNEYFN